MRRLDQLRKAWYRQLVMCWFKELIPMMTTRETVALWTPERIDHAAQEGAQWAAQLSGDYEMVVKSFLTEDYYAIANEADDNGILLADYIPGLGTTQEQRGADCMTSRELVKRICDYLSARGDEHADVTLQDKMYGADRPDKWWDSRRPDDTTTKIGTRSVYGIAIPRRLEGTNADWEAQTHALAQRIKETEGTSLLVEGMSVTDWLVNHALGVTHRDNGVAAQRFVQHPRDIESTIENHGPAVRVCELRGRLSSTDKRPYSGFGFRTILGLPAQPAA